MYLPQELPVFFWPRGDPNRWAITKIGTPVLTYGGEWSSYQGRAEFVYMPLDRPEMYEEFAAIGDLALSVGAEVESPSYRREYETEDGSRIVAVANEDPGLVGAAS